MAFALFILLLVILKSSKNEDIKNSELYKWIIGGNAILIPISLFLSILNSSSGLSVFALLAIIGYFIYKKQKQNEEKIRQQKYGWDEHSTFKNTTVNSSFDSTNDSKSSNSADNITTGQQPKDSMARAYSNYSNKSTYSRKLPKSKKGRLKLLDNFNKKFNLYLEEDQMNSIVDSSYFSETWKKELEAMDEKYDTLYNWFDGPTTWLRLYIWCFIPQEITYDIIQQEKICFCSFDSVFKYAESLGNVSRAEVIKRCNEKFFCQFDDITFTMSLKYMSTHGRSYKLGVASPMEYDSRSSKLSDLEKKYEDVPVEG